MKVDTTYCNVCKKRKVCRKMCKKLDKLLRGIGVGRHNEITFDPSVLEIVAANRAFALVYGNKYVRDYRRSKGNAGEV